MKKRKRERHKGGINPTISLGCCNTHSWDHRYKSEQLHPFQRGEDTEMLHSLLSPKSGHPGLWHCSCEVTEAESHPHGLCNATSSKMLTD